MDLLGLERDDEVGCFLLDLDPLFPFLPFLDEFFFRFLTAADMLLDS